MSNKATTSELVPVIVDVGSVKKKKVDRLKKGEGPLMNEVRAVIAEVSDALSDHVEGKAILPVVLIYRRKKKRDRFGLFPIPGFFYDDDDDDDDDDD